MEQSIQRARIIAKLLDSQFKFGKYSFGIESFLGFIPFVGDVIGILLALYIYRIGHRMGISKRHKAEMIFNIVLDFFIGLVPFIGDIFDVVYKANLKNVKILEKHSRGNVIEGEIEP